VFRLPRAASDAFVAGVRAQDRGEDFLGRRLAVRPGDRDHDRRETFAQRPIAETAPRLIDHKDWQRRRARVPRVDHRAGAPPAREASKSWPKCSPRIATNRSPFERLRLSVEHR
jgi:hypothetical protein